MVQVRTEVPLQLAEGMEVMGAITPSALMVKMGQLRVAAEAAQKELSPVRWWVEAVRMDGLDSRIHRAAVQLCLSRQVHLRYAVGRVFK